jgi:hypothetical protein
MFKYLRSATGEAGFGRVSYITLMQEVRFLAARELTLIARSPLFHQIQPGFCTRLSFSKPLYIRDFSTIG